MSSDEDSSCQKVCNARNNYEGSPRPFVIGEWSIAVWQCSAAEGNSAMGDVGTCELSAGNFNE